MKEFNLVIDGKNLKGKEGQTILDIAKENNISIPTLCYDERMEIYGSCGLCVCEVEGNPKMVKACATLATEGMVVKTDTERVKESRKTNLELLLSNHIGDCRPPCKISCPAGTDVQGYVGLIANGEYTEALKLIKDCIPLPGALGRVCPHPCEYDCRRTLVDGDDNPISIQFLKRFASDYDFKGENPFIPDIAEETGKKVSIIGGGPMGLSSAYFLRQKGHDITIYEGMPKLGGMLRYGIPEYRLPKAELDKEIKIIEDMGVKLVPNTKVGRDISFEEIRSKSDAVILGIGAWKSTGVGCKGEDLAGVTGAIYFLEKVVSGKEVDIKGKNVAIVGGGNTAMDACRTAVRLGAKNVYNIYRRTKAEMPADEIEIIEAEEEGVIFKNLTNPIEFLEGEDGNVKYAHLQHMELGEPDASGRRSPKPIEGKTEMLEVDVVILGIGQAVDATPFDTEKTRKNGIVFDKSTFMTSLEGVFAGGDCGNDRISIAVEAIGDAKHSTEVIDQYLKGKKVRYEKPYFVRRYDITEKTFEDRERLFKSTMEQLEPDERKDNFEEVMKGFTEQEAQCDASRCLECGCHDYFECKLIKYSHQYDVNPDRMAGEINTCEVVDDHPFIVRDPNKCILCGLCVRACDEVMGIAALGLVGRGFDTVVKPTLEKPLLESGCVSCGQCVNVCPTGALQERHTMPKPVPVDSEKVSTTCSFCSVGCSLDFEFCGDLMVKSVPNKNGAVNKGLSCGKGKWGFDIALKDGKLEESLLKSQNGFDKVSYDKAIEFTVKRFKEIGEKYGKDSLAISISDRFTNEEAYVMKKMADDLGAKVLCLNNRKSGLEKVLGIDKTPNEMDEMFGADVVLVTGYNVVLNPVVQLKIKQAAEKGVKVILINPEGMEQHFDFAEKIIYTDNTLNSLKEIAKVVLEDNKNEIKGLENLVKWVSDVEVSKEIREVAEIYKNSEKSMILFQQNLVSEGTATLIGDIAVASGHIGSESDGVIQIKSKNNSQGIIDLGIKGTAEDLQDVKALMVFGEDMNMDTSNLEFLMVSDVYMTSLSEKADVVLPIQGFTSSKGTYTNTDGRLLEVQPSINEGNQMKSWELVSELNSKFGFSNNVNSVEDIEAEMKSKVDTYRNSVLNEVLKPSLNENVFELLVPETDEFTSPLLVTDNLMNRIASLIPKPVRR